MIITILRKPLEGTVAENTLKHGCGALNIDATRVKHNEDIKVIKAQETGNLVFGQSGRYEDTTELKPEGRWPANFILTHKEGCELKGTKKVKSNPGGGKTKSSIGGDGIYAKGKERVWKNHADKDGKETISDWACEEGCPVQELDEQDSGGASRFFKQFKKENDQ